VTVLAPAPRRTPLELARPARCQVMAVLNVTPDSFSDGGRFAGPEAAVEEGLRLVAQGADLVDVGGESTRPGAARVSREEELRRVVPVVAGLAAAGVTVSIDTMRAEVAHAALDAGAAVVNDVSGGLADPAMLPLVAAADVPCVLMHWRGHSAGMQARARYADVVGEVRDELSRRVDAALAEGVRLDRIVLDPGLGFAKDAGHSWDLLAALPRLRELGLPLLVGASRKRFLAECLTYPGADASHPAGRDDASAAVAALVASAGAWGVRVHAPGAAAAGVRVASRLRQAELAQSSRGSCASREGVR